MTTVASRTPTFEELEMSPVTYKSTIRCTHSDVMKTTCTSKVFVSKLSLGNKNASLRRMKLPSAESVPTLSISNDRKNKILMKERQEFMER